MDVLLAKGLGVVKALRIEMRNGQRLHAA